MKIHQTSTRSNHQKKKKKKKNKKKDNNMGNSTKITRKA